MKKNSGFSLVELAAVLAIVAILAVVSIPIYNGHIKKSVLTEADATLAEISATHEIYRARNNKWSAASRSATTAVNTILGIDTRRNKYFNTYSWAAASTTAPLIVYTVTGKTTEKRASGVSRNYTYSVGAPAIIS